MSSVYWELILLKAMGRKSHTPLSAGTPYFLPSRGKRVARGFVTDEEKQRFTVRQGARAPKKWKKSASLSNRRLKDKLLEEGVFVEMGGELELIQDYEFEKPSPAASVFLGCNGHPQKWKEDTETRLKDNSIKRHAQQVADGYDAPLQRFAAQVRGLPRTTEAKRSVVGRIGQGDFRADLMKYWQGCCPLTGISDQDLLWASHIRRWADCQSDAERLDVYNGLLLSSLWNDAFDKGLVTFDDGGYPQFSPHLGQATRAALGCGKRISLTSEHQNYLAWHRQRVFRR